MRMWRKETLRKAMSMLLCLVMVLGMLPVPVLAEETGCTVADCTGSYVEGVCNVCGSSEIPAVPEEKQECSHSGGTATCKALAVCEKCGTAYGERVVHNFDADGKCSCGAECEHNYAEGKCTACGMAEPVPVDPAVEAVKALIEALPTVEEFVAMPREEQTAIHDGAYMAAGNDYNALTEEQKASLDVAKLMALAAWFADPNNAVPADEPATSGTTGDCTWNVENGTLTISGNGAMADYGSGGAPWYDQKDSITSLVIGSEVTTIGKDAFAQFSKITDVTIPASVTTVKDYAFFDCTGLTTVTYHGTSNPGGSDVGFNTQFATLQNIYVPANYTDSSFCGISSKLVKGIPHSITVSPTGSVTVTVDGTAGTVAKKDQKIAIAGVEGQTPYTVQVADVNGASVAVTKQEDGIFTFFMPDCDVTVTAIFLTESDEVLYGSNESEAMPGTWNNAVADDAQYIRLLKDIELKDGNPMTIGSGKTVTLDLNSHDLIQTTSGQFVIKVDGGSLTLTGSGNVTHNYSDSNKVFGSGVWISSGSLNMTGGTITGNHANGDNGGGIYMNGGTLTMSGGEISGNTAGAGGGISIAGGEATVSGTAEITSNRASSTSGYGGGICVHTGGTLNLSGGTIADNISSGGYGGGIAVLGTCKLSGNPVVDNNKRGSIRDNLYVGDNAPIIIDGELARYAQPQIGVTTYDVTFTSGWAAKMTDENGTVAPPEYYFKYDSGQLSVYLSGDEAVVGTLTSRDLTVTKKNSSLDFIAASYGDTITLVATPSEGGGTISWILGNEIVATGSEYDFTSYQLDYNNMKVTISADTNRTVKYASVTKDFSVYVQKKTLTAADITLVLPQNAAYTADMEWEASITGPADFENGTVELLYYREGDATPITGKPKDAGTYIVEVAINGSANYNNVKLRDDAWRFTISPATTELSLEFDDNLTYTGNPIPVRELKVNGADYTGEVTYSFTGTSNGQQVNGEGLPTNAGTYTITASIPASGNYGAGETFVTVTIGKAGIDPVVSITGWAYGSYSAEKNAPTVSGNSGEGVVTYAYKTRGADDSSYVDVVPSAAGSYTVKATVAETANYLGGEAAADFDIGKAAIHPSVSITGWTYGENANAPTVSGNTGNGVVTYQYKAKTADDSTYSENVPSAAGDYTVRATVAVTANYNGGTDTADFSISKADISPVVSITGWKYGAAANVPSVSGNPGNGAVTYEYKLQKADDNAYSVDVPTVVGFYTVRATVAATSNYNGGTAVANFSISKADITPTVSITGWTYGDTANDPSVAENTGNGSVTYQYKAKDAGDNTYTGKVPTDAGDYTVKAAIAETEYYAAATATTDFTIARKPVTVSGITAKNKTYDGTTNADLDCTQAILNGKLDGDTLTVTAVGTFADKNVGTNKTVSITKLVLGGASADNYVQAGTGQQAAGTAAITPREITVEITSNGGTYGGTIIAATAEVKNAVSGEDPAVTLTYTGNGYNSQAKPTNAGKYTVTATISNTNYTLTGSTTAEFVMAKANVEVPTIASKVYNGAVQIADVTATDKYSVAENNGGTEIGEYAVVLNLTDPDNYKWEDAEEATKTLIFKIAPRGLQDADVTLTADLTYNAKTQEPSVTVRDGESVLAKDTHYTVTYEKVGPNDSGVPMNDKPVDAGDYNAVITGIGSCDGTVKKSFKIKPCTTITVVPETLTAVTYTGEEIKPEITVNGADNQDLVKNTDYTIGYENNTNAGTAKVIITGIGNYAGAEKELTFTIKAKELTNDNVTIAETILRYEEGKTTVPEITVKDGSRTLAEGTDYVVGYLDKDGSKVAQPSAIGIYTVQIIGVASLSEDSTGNYFGTVSKPFVITDDVTAPEITGVTSGKTYYTTQKAVAKDTNLISVTRNGSIITPVVPDGTEVTLSGSCAVTYTVTATDIAELETSVTVTMAPISTLDDTIKTLTVDNVKLSDKDTIQSVLDRVDPIRKDECGNATQAETDALDAIIKKCNDLLKVITDAEDAISKIQALPNPAETAPDNETAVKAYDEAKKAYDALSEQGKELVGAEAKAKLDAMLKALTAYDVIQGHKSSYTKGSGKTFSITANGYFGKFTGLKVDGKLLDSKHYTAESGSTIVTLKNGYLDRLSDGKHTIEFLYTDGTTGGAHYFRISSNNGSPFTGDDNHIMMFSGLMMTSLLGMVMMFMFAPKKKGKYQR